MTDIHIPRISFVLLDISSLYIYTNISLSFFLILLHQRITNKEMNFLNFYNIFEVLQIFNFIYYFDSYIGILQNTLGVLDKILFADSSSVK